MSWDQTEQIDFLHFNDVYHLNRIEAVSKFASVLDKERHSLSPAPDDLAFVIFSGDALSPALEASIHQGSHMIPLLNMLKVDVACPGNHDFDFGEQRLRTLIGASHFPWTLSNYTNSSMSDTRGFSPPSTESCLAGTQPFVIREKRGFRFGFFGLGGTDWCQSTIGLPAQCHVHRPAATARRMAYYLRTVQKCDFVIAVTHMRLAEDLEVATETEAQDEWHVDMLLGGHDHAVLSRFQDDEPNPDPQHICPGQSNAEFVRYGRAITRYGRPRIVKSGSDFESYSKVRFFAQRKADGQAHLLYASVQQTVRLPDITAFATLRPHCAIENYLVDLGRRTSALINKPVAYLTAPLDGREAVVRQRDTNLGQFLCHVMRTMYKADMALINAGAIRCDRLIGTDQVQVGCDLRLSLLSLGDVLDIVPFQDTFAIKLVTHDQLKDMLEIAVSSDWPNGSFLQSSGISYQIDRARPVGTRVSNLRVSRATFDMMSLSPSEKRRFGRKPTIKSDFCQETYAVVVPSFLAGGHDGFNMLLPLPTIDPLCSAQLQWTFAELVLHYLREKGLHHHLPMPSAKKSGFQASERRLQHVLPVIQPPGLPHVRCKSRECSRDRIEEGGVPWVVRCQHPDACEESAAG